MTKVIFKSSKFRPEPRFFPEKDETGRCIVLSSEDQRDKAFKAFVTYRSGYCWSADFSLATNLFSVSELKTFLFKMNEFGI